MIAAGGPALLFNRVRGADVPLATNLFGTARRAEMAFGKRPVALVRRLAELAPTPAAADAAQALGGARPRPRGAPPRHSPPPLRAGARGRHPRRAARPPAGPDLLARGRRAVRHPAAGLHRASRRPRPQPRGSTACRSTTRRTTGMHWQIGKGGGYHYAVAEARGEALPVTVFLGGPPALILAAVAPLPENVPELLLASLLAGRKLDLVPRPRARTRSSPTAEIALVGRVPAARAQARGAVRRPLRLLLAAPRLPGLRGRAAGAAARRDLPGDRRRQAAAGGLLHRRPAAGAAVAALPAGHAGGRGALVLRRDRLPLARRGGRQAALPARGDGRRLPHPRRGAALADQVPARDRPAGRPARLPRHPRAPARAHPPRDRPLRLRQHLDGHARLHRPGGEPRLEGGLAGAGGGGAGAAAGVPAGGAAAARGDRRAGLLRRLPRRRQPPPLRRPTRAPPPASPRTRPSPAGRSSS